LAESGLRCVILLMSRCYGQVVHFRQLPTPCYHDAVAFGYRRVNVSPDGDSHPAGCTPSQAHERARPRAQPRGTPQRVRIERQTFNFQLFDVTKPFSRNIAKYKLRDTSRAASPGRPDDFIQLELHRFAVAVLGVLDQKHHQERHDRRRCVDYQLPGIAKMKSSPNHRPHDNDCYSQPERGWPPCRARRRPGESLEKMGVLNRGWGMVFAIFSHFPAEVCACQFSNSRPSFNFRVSPTAVYGVLPAACANKKAANQWRPLQTVVAKLKPNRVVKVVLLSAQGRSA